MVREAMTGLEMAHPTVGGVTVLVSHRFSTVRMADLILVLSRGRIVEVGDHRQLVELGGRYAGRFQLQAAAYHGSVPASPDQDCSASQSS